jgi:hypothetical protein
VTTDIFNLAGATLKNQQFYAVYKNSFLGLSVLRLSYTVAKNQVFTNPPQESYDNFSLSLAKQSTTNLTLFNLWEDAVNSHNGEVFFKNINKIKYKNDLTTLDTQKHDDFDKIIAFDILFDGVGFSKNFSFFKPSTRSESTVFDCDTAYSIFPNDWVQSIHKQFNVTYFNVNNIAYIDCNFQSESYTVDFIFDFFAIQVLMSYLVSLHSLNPKACSFGLVSAGSRHSLLGDNFLSSSYTVFDLTNNQISLATRDFSSTTDDVVAVPAGGVKAIGFSISTSNSSSTDTGTASVSTTSSSKTSEAPVFLFSTYLASVLFVVLSLKSIF